LKRRVLSVINQWLSLGPEAMYWAPKFRTVALRREGDLSSPRMGCATDNVVADDGKVYDTDRRSGGSTSRRGRSPT
jgi:hypothetical protein